MSVTLRTFIEKCSSMAHLFWKFVLGVKSPNTQQKELGDCEYKLWTRNTPLKYKRSSDTTDQYSMHNNI